MAAQSTGVVVIYDDVARTIGYWMRQPNPSGLRRVKAYLRQLIASQ